MTEATTAAPTEQSTSLRAYIQSLIHEWSKTLTALGFTLVPLFFVLDIFMMSADSGYFEKHPNSLLVFETLKHAKEKGYTYYNWQSCSSRESSVYHYKLGWGSREGLHYYLTRRVGDTGPLERTPLTEVVQRYAWHYVMPYERWKPAEIDASDSGQ